MNKLALSNACTRHTRAIQNEQVPLQHLVDGAVKQTMNKYTDNKYTNHCTLYKPL